MVTLPEHVDGGREGYCTVVPGPPAPLSCSAGLMDNKTCEYLHSVLWNESETKCNFIGLYS